MNRTCSRCGNFECICGDSAFEAWTAANPYTGSLIDELTDMVARTEATEPIDEQERRTR